MADSVPTKTMGFAPSLVPLILTGQKTVTYRLGGRYQDLAVGDCVDLINSATNKVFAKVTICQKSQSTFAKLPLAQFGHESYESKMVQRQIFELYYKRPVADAEPVLVFGFTLNQT